jgi:hypothetical protein
MNEDLVIVPVICSTIGWITWSIFSTIRRYVTARLQAGVQTKLVDKLGSNQELLTYVQSDAGKRLVESLGVERASPYGRIIGALQAGVILIPFGLGLLFLRGRIVGADEGFLVFGTLICTLGIGFVLAAAVSYTLSKSFGLLEHSTAPRQ